MSNVAQPRVVLVDDDDVFRLITAASLSDAGYEVVSLPDPILALEELESRRPIDALITDVNFATGLPHGFSLARMARARRPGLPVVLVTGFPDIAEQDKTPPGPVFVKPVDPAVLKQALIEQIDRRRGARQPVSRPRARGLMKS